MFFFFSFCLLLCLSSERWNGTFSFYSANQRSSHSCSKSKRLSCDSLEVFTILKTQLVTGSKRCLKAPLQREFPPVGSEERNQLLLHNEEVIALAAKA